MIFHIDWRDNMFKYKNPFSDFDSNVMSSKQIADFFTEPYESFTIPESKIIEDKSPIRLC